MSFRWIVRGVACVMWLVSFIVWSAGTAGPATGPDGGSTLPLQTVRIEQAAVINTAKMGPRQTFTVAGETTGFTIHENLANDPQLQAKLAAALVPDATVQIAFDPQWYRAMSANPEGQRTPVQRIEADGQVVYDMFIYQKDRAVTVTWLARGLAVIFALMGFGAASLSFIGGGQTRRR